MFDNLTNLTQRTKSIGKLAGVGSLLAALALAGPVQAATTTWKAYVDHGPGTIGTQTATHTTVLNLSTPGTANLTNITDGTVPLGPSGNPVTITVSLVGTINSLGSGVGVPDPNTDLYNEFNGYVYFGASTPNGAIQIPQTCTISLTFSNLNPSMRYRFKGGMVRGNNYLDRWSLIDILGIDSCVPNHKGGSCTAPYTFATASTPGQAGLSGYEAAFNFGENRCGAMVEYDDINPGPDGVFTVTSTRFTGTIPGASTAASSGYSYAISGLSLEEYTTCSSFTVALPSNPTVTECSSYTLTAEVQCGLAPYTFYWFHDPLDGSGYQQMSEANQSIVFSSIRSSDAGNYYVIVTDSTPSEQGGPFMGQSDPTTITVSGDTTPPTMLGPAVGPDLNTIIVSFSRPISFSGVSAFTVVPTNGVGALSINSAVVTNATNVILTTTAARAGQLYKVVANSGISTCNGLQVTPGSFVTVVDEVTLMDFTGHSWQYNETGTDLTGEWLANNYDDHSAGWQEGTGAFDNVAGGRTTVGGVGVGTVILLTNTASQFPRNLPSYYFRTHVTMPQNFDPAQTAVNMRWMADDGIIVYVNGTEAFRTTNMVDGVNTGFTNYLGMTAVGTAAISTNVSVDPHLLVSGDNVVAVYLKQVNASSSDISMDLELKTVISNYIPQTVYVNVEVNPTSVTVPQCGSFTLTASATGGKAPYSWEWFQGTTPLSGQNNATLTINNAQLSNGGNYHVRVTDSAATPYVTNSAPVSVTVTPDSAPVLVSALSQTDLRTLVLSFDKAVAISSASGGNFTLTPSIALTGSFVTNGNQVVLVTGADLGQENYTVNVGSGVTGTCSGLASSGSARLVQQILVAGTKVNNTWQYNDSGTDLEPAGWLANSYDDHSAGWLTGTAVFDGKTPQPPGRTTVGGETVGTQLSLTNANFPSTNAVVPSYYYRRHFTLNASPADVSLQFRRMFDDHGVVYLNGQEGYRDTNIVATNYAFANYIELGGSVGTAGWSAVQTFPTTNLFKGDNVLAVYMKQATPGSSDTTMGLEVTATVTNFAPLGPRLSIVDNGSTVTVSWTPSGSGTLYYSSNLGAAPNTWTSAGTSNPQTFNKADAQYRFFQVR